jgi:hypothetical protein
MVDFPQPDSPTIAFRDFYDNSKLRLFNINLSGSLGYEKVTFSNFIIPINFYGIKPSIFLFIFTGLSIIL